MKKMRFIVFFPILITILGCAHQQDVQLRITSTNTPMPNEPTETLIPPTASYTSVPPTLTLAPTNTFTPTITLSPTNTYTPTSTPMPPGWEIAFASNRDGNFEIYVMNVDGSAQTNITNHEAEDTWPSKSPDGRNIVFVSARDAPTKYVSCCKSELYLVNIDGTELKRLTDDVGDKSFPAWSPDGEHIVYTNSIDEIGYSRKTFDIFIMKSDGSEILNLTYGSVWAIYPVWWTRGSQIAFLGIKDGGFHYYIMNNDGTGRTRMDSGLPSTTGPDDGAYFTPSDIGIYEFYYFYEGSDLIVLQDSELALGEFPSWSPDGSKIAFHSNRNGNMDIYLMNADLSEITRITEDEANDMFPTWSPDGSQIAFQSNRDGNVEIYVMNADGTNQRRLTNNPADDCTPAWYP